MVINAQEFLEAIEAIELNKGISREVVLTSLEEAMKKGYKKELGGDDAVVEVIIKPEDGIIEMFNIKDIVDEVEDDFLQVSLEDAKALQKEGKGEIRGDKFYISASIETLKKATANSIKSILKQKFAEAEKLVLYDTFKDKINTMITGKVEKVDERGCSVNIGRTSVFLPRKEMIGDERFSLGDDIRLFVDGVTSGTKGAHINVSRASEGFLKALFFEEIREIYDGTIVIKGIAREAGERSKVAVYTTDPNVDPAGACIGQNGNRIQKIVSQLGNGQAKEKIDIIAYSENPGLYVMEALKPAKVAGVKIADEGKSATVIVKDDSLSLAIGRRGVNARLAVRLTGYNIDIKTETDALNEGFEFTSFEELQALENETNARRAEEARLASANAQHTGEVLPGLPEGYVAPQERVYEEEGNDFDEALRERAEEDDFVPSTTEEEEPTPAPVVETPVEEEPTPAPVEEPTEEIKEVKTTTTLEDLERTLESGSSKQGGKKTGGKKSKKKVEEEEEVTPISPKQDPSTFMSIYTDEELAEMDEEEDVEEEYDDEDVDYDEYDEYYDDDDK